MRNRDVRSVALAAGMAIALVTGGCGTSQPWPPSKGQIAAALDDEGTGGFSTADEESGFGFRSASRLDPAPVADLEQVWDHDGAASCHGKSGPGCAAALAACHRGGWLLGERTQLALGYGYGQGKWTDEQGKVAGEFVTIYGTNSNNRDLLFGKVIDLEGRFVGLLKGRYEGNQFSGQLMDGSRRAGFFRGIYVDDLIVGRWREACGGPQPPRDSGLWPTDAVMPTDAGAGWPGSDASVETDAGPWRPVTDAGPWWPGSDASVETDAGPWRPVTDAGPWWPGSDASVETDAGPWRPVTDAGPWWPGSDASVETDAGSWRPVTDAGPSWPACDAG